MEHFQKGWLRLRLPISGKVFAIDNGEPAVGLSAMQLYALGINNGIVKIRFKDQTCDAKVWNAYGVNASGEEDEIRITDTLAKNLGCETGDYVDFIEVVAHTLPVKIGPIG